MVLLNPPYVCKYLLRPKSARAMLEFTRAHIDRLDPWEGSYVLEDWEEHPLTYEQMRILERLVTKLLALGCRP